MDELCLRLTMGLHFDPCQCHSTPNSATHLSQRTSFSVIVPAGQDATLIYIGWTTQDFKYLPAFFKKSCTTGIAPGCQAFKIVDTRSSDSKEYVKSLTLSIENMLHIVILRFVLLCMCMFVGNFYARIVVQIQSFLGIILLRYHFQVTHCGKLYPTIVTTPTTETVATFKLTPEEVQSSSAIHCDGQVHKHLFTICVLLYRGVLHCLTWF